MTAVQLTERQVRFAASGVLVDSADVPGGGKLRLLRCGADWEIIYGDEQLMGSWCFRSEQALATLALTRLGDRAHRVLIGGLGMGFTLAAARALVAPGTRIIVAELVPEVVAWARGPLAHIVGDSLEDARVSLENEDVHDLIEGRRAAYDAILLDVDNGPEGLISAANERLYCDWGLREAHAALRPGGVLAVWSAYPDAPFAARLEAADFQVDEVRIGAAGRGRDAAHTIWLAEKAPS